MEAEKTEVRSEAPALVATTQNEIIAAPPTTESAPPPAEIIETVKLGEAPQLAIATDIAPPTVSAIAAPAEAASSVAAAIPPVAAPAEIAAQASPMAAVAIAVQTAVSEPAIIAPARAIETAAIAAPVPIPAVVSTAAAPGIAPPEAAVPASATVLPFAATPKAPAVASPTRDEAPKSERAPSRAGRFGLLAASIAIAAAIGGAAGAAGFAAVSKLATQAQAVRTPAPKGPVQRAESADEIKALKDSIAQVRGSVRAVSDTIAGLRSSTDNAGKTAQIQFAKLYEAVDRVERAQAEPNARIAKLAEAVERIERRTAAVSGPATPLMANAHPETTGSIKPLPPLGTDARAPKPVVEGWTLREVHEGIALVQGRHGAYEVVIGDDIRGVGRVQDIRRQDGRWVVVTNRGIILSAR